MPCGATRQHHVAEGQMLAGRAMHRTLAAGHYEADRADEDGQQPQRSQAPLLIEDHAQRSAQRHGAIGADAIERDDPGGVLRVPRW